MGDPVALYVRYIHGQDPIRDMIELEQIKNPSKSLRTILEELIHENEQLKQQVNSQKPIMDRLDLLVDIHNSYIIDKNIFAVYPTSMKTADMIRALEDERIRLTKRTLERDEEE